MIALQERWQQPKEASRCIGYGLRLLSVALQLQLQLQLPIPISILNLMPLIVRALKTLGVPKRIHLLKIAPSASREIRQHDSIRHPNWELPHR